MLTLASAMSAHKIILCTVQPPPPPVPAAPVIPAPISKALNNAQSGSLQDTIGLLNAISGR
jgi:hypothetical protein